MKGMLFTGRKKHYSSFCSLTLCSTSFCYAIVTRKGDLIGPRVRLVRPVSPQGDVPMQDQNILIRYSKPAEQHFCASDYRNECPHNGLVLKHFR